MSRINFSKFIFDARWFNVRFLFIAIPFSLQGSVDFNDNCKEAYMLVFQLEYSKAQQLIEQEKTTDPLNIVPFYVEHYQLALQAFVTEQKSVLEKSLKQRQVLLSKLEGEDDENPFIRFIHAECLLQSALARIKFNEYLRAANDIRKANQLLQKNKEKFPSFHLNNKGLGLLQTLAGSVPEQYMWLLKIAGMSGTVMEGVSLLNNLYLLTESPELNWQKNEVQFILGYIRLNIENNMKAAMQTAYEIQHDQGPFLLFLKTSTFMKNGNNDLALQLINEKDDDKKKLPFLHYITGLLLLHKNDDSAINNFKTFLENYSGKNFRAAAYQKIGWFYLLRAKPSEYRNYISKAGKEHSITDEDKQAVSEAKKKVIPNPGLLRARLYFDGGYYEQSYRLLDVIIKDGFSKKSDEIEARYRMARALQAMNKYSEALTIYFEVMEFEQKNVPYFIPNSALQVGLIYEEKKEIDNARKFFHKALSYKNHEYKNSIDQKARAGLSRLNRFVN